MSALSTNDPSKKTNLLSFFVPGEPTPQGSKKCFCRGGRASMVESARNHKGARKQVTDCAKRAIQATEGWYAIAKPLPVSLTIEFVYETPKSRKTWWGAWRTVAPDVDKLTRLIGDSLTDAGVYGDDSQISALHCIKYEVALADVGRTAPDFGAYITVDCIRENVGPYKARTGIKNDLTDPDVIRHNESMQQPRSKTVL